MPLQYQLVTLGPNAGLYEELLGVRLREDLVELNLNPSRDFTVLGVDERSALNAKGSVVGLWFGGGSPFEREAEHKAFLKSLLEMGVKMLPLVEDRDYFMRQIPQELRSINGIVWNDALLPGDVLKAFGLTRELRQAFISYKRTDSVGIARQMAHTLFERGYQIFLDTASIERGDPFQDVLRDRLANIDLVVLLDSPNALQSKWVHEELDLVHQLGLGVLQLAWSKPNPSDPSKHDLQATKGTEFSIRFPLEASHFEDPNVTLGADAKLRPEVLTQIADRAEQARIRSLGARRTRVVSYLHAEASRMGLEVNAQPTGPVEIQRGDRIIATAYPLIGLPDAWVIDEHERRIAGEHRETMQAGDFGPYRIIFDGLGILDERLKHLTWLNNHLYLKTLRTELLQDWLTSHE